MTSLRSQQVYKSQSGNSVCGYSYCGQTGVGV